MAMNDGHVQLGYFLEYPLHLLMVSYPFFYLRNHVFRDIDGVGLAFDGDRELVGKMSSPPGGDERSPSHGAEFAQFLHPGIPALDESIGRWHEILFHGHSYLLSYIT